jgi:hypothetical protein
MSDETAERIARMKRHSPQAVELAQLLSFAVLIDPALMRETRLELLPGADVGAEADLWFGPLVQTRNRDGIVLMPGVAETLRVGLSETLAAEAFRITKRLHDYLPPAVQLEERLNFLSRDPAGNAVEIAELFQSAVVALVKHGRSEIANWAGRALPRLTQRLRSNDGARMLAAASDLRLGRQLERAPYLADAIPSWFAAVMPEGFATVALGVSVAGEVLTLDPRPASDLHVIAVPETNPRIVQLSERLGGERRTQLIAVEPNAAQSVRLIDQGPVELVTLGGQAFTVERIAGRANSVAGIAARTYSNCNHVLIAWQMTPPAMGLLGFALERIDDNSKSRFIRNWLGFDDRNGKPEPRSSTDVPIQRFLWLDRPPPGSRTYAYRITPVTGAPGKSMLHENQAALTRRVEVANTNYGPITAVFNGASGPTQDRQQWTEDSNGAERRDAAGGEVRRALLSLLAEARDTGATVYAALFILDDPELIEALAAFRLRANIILASDRTRRNSDRLAHTVKALGGTRVKLRANAGRLAHASFMVVCDADGKPRRVWSGSTAWTSRAFYGQDSNAFIIHDEEVASRYVGQWDVLSNDAVAGPLREFNGAPRHFTLSGGTTVQLRFAPVRNNFDLAEVRGLLAQARSAILFAVGPRSRRSIVDDILNVSGLLYVAGVARGASDMKQISVYQHGDEMRLTVDREQSEALLREAGLVSKALASPIGSRLIVIDPLDTDPTVICGSHTLSESASRFNDEDLLIIRGNRELAQACAVHIKGLIDHYAFRAAARHRRRSVAVTLSRDDSWLRRYTTDEALRELAFWMGAGPVPSAASAPVRPATDEPPARAPRKKAAKKTAARKTSKVAKKATQKTTKVVKKTTQKTRRAKSSTSRRRMSKSKSR